MKNKFIIGFISSIIAVLVIIIIFLIIKLNSNNNTISAADQHVIDNSHQVSSEVNTKIKEIKVFLDNQEKTIQILEEERNKRDQIAKQYIEGLN